jgi:carbonic anhydrase/acetyltransferase-like protein (isoleucine patch superfamily)
MGIFRYGERVPSVGDESFVSETAVVVGDVTVGRGCYVGHGAVLRGDYGAIRVGDGSAVEEGAVLHIRPGGLLALEDRVTVGHGALVHGRLLKSHAVVGIGAVLGFDVVVGRWAIVAEGCVVPQGTEIPDEIIFAGVPGKPLGPVEERHRSFWTAGKQLYVDLAREYPAKFERIG